MTLFVNRILTVLVVFVSLLACLLIPAYATSLLFEYSLWLARAVVYLFILVAVVYGVRDYRIHIILYSWIKRRFGVRIF